MEPMLPELAKDLEERAFDLSQRSARLGGSLHPITRSAVIEVVRSMNSYYSNLIEGHNTHPIDIEKALRHEYSDDPSKRALQLESKAHVEVQRFIEQRLPAEPELQVCSSEFLRWIHREFYARLPREFRDVKNEAGKTVTVIPGELRECEVSVSNHIPPASKNLAEFLTRFAEAYEPSNLGPMQRIVAAAASHHRLAWIHPFLDGNGRVSRLFTHAYLIKTKVDGHGLWMVSRGFSRRHSEYMSALAAADSRRRSDIDGRGNLSAKELASFSRFFIDVAIDQVDFMSQMLDLDSMRSRLASFAKLWCHEVGSRMDPGALGHLLTDLFTLGEITRGEATAILNMPERTAREAIRSLINHELISSEGLGRPLRLAFPTFAFGFYFPRLYPDAVAADFTIPRAAKPVA